MEIKIAFNEFDLKIKEINQKLNSISTFKVQDDLESVRKEYESIRSSYIEFIRQNTSEDLMNDLLIFVQEEGQFNFGIGIPFHQAVKNFQDRVRKQMARFENLLCYLSISDPLISNRSFETERANFTVGQKQLFLLEKLYALRKADNYFNTYLIFKLNQVELDNPNEAREITSLLAKFGYVETIGLTGPGLLAQITSIGKARYEEESSKPSQKGSNSQTNTNEVFVDLDRIEDLRNLISPKHDFRKLVKLCEELNDNFGKGNYLSVAMLGRAILDHVPPIFGFTSFNEVANNYGIRSFKKNMDHLNTSMRSIADNFLHSPIRKTESLPNASQVSFSPDIDVLLAEIIRKVTDEAV
jgi:hypothetical protein